MLFVHGGVLTYEYNALTIERTRISSSAPLPTGRVKLEIESRLGEGRNSAMDVTIRADGEVVAHGTVPVTAAVGFTTNDSLDVEALRSERQISEAIHAAFSPSRTFPYALFTFRSVGMIHGT